MRLVQTLRRSLRAPGFALAVLLLTAAVVAVNATVFAAVWAVNYKALPYRDAERLVELRADLSNYGFAVGLSKPLYDDLSAANDIHEGLVGYSTSVFNRSDAAGQDWRIRRIMPDFAAVLGVQPALGRGLLDEDIRQEAKVLLLSDKTWRSRFGADPGVLGREVLFGSDRYLVVGVMPPGFSFPDTQDDAWMPYVPSTGERNNDARGNVGGFEVAARLVPGISATQARDRLAAIFENAPSLAGLRTSAGLRADVRSWRERFIGEHWLALSLLQAASLILLAVVAVNLAHLVLDRMLARQRDLSVCRAMGARDIDIVRSVLADLLPPALAGVLAGLAFVPFGISLLRARGLMPIDLPITAGGDAATIIVAGLVSAVVIVIALFAAMSVRSEAAMAVGMNVRQQASGLGRARASMLIVQVAMTTILLGGSLLLLRSAINLINEPRGFDENGVLMTSIDPLGVSRGLEYDEARDGDRLRTGLRAIREDVAALPGVRHAAFASMAPFSNWESVSSLRMPGVEGELQARARDVGPQYFSALGIPFVLGREFAESDIGDASPAIVDELFVERWLQGRDPIGATVEVPIGEGRYQAVAIIGVVRTIKHEALDETPELPTLYQLEPVSLPVVMLVTRVDGDPATFAEAVRDRVSAHFPDAYVSFNRPLSEAVAQTLVGRRAVVEAVSAFALVTLVLAVLGLYAVLSFAVRRRTAELGVRMALGADASRVRNMVLGQGGSLVAIGVIAGAVVGMPLARLFADRLHRIDATDPPTWLITGIVVVLAALFACWWPARRATRIPPSVALQAP